MQIYYKYDVYNRIMLILYNRIHSTQYILSRQIKLL